MQVSMSCHGNKQIIGVAGWNDKFDITWNIGLIIIKITRGVKNTDFILVTRAVIYIQRKKQDRKVLFYLYSNNVSLFPSHLTIMKDLLSSLIACVSMATQVLHCFLCTRSQTSVSSPYINNKMHSSHNVYFISAKLSKHLFNLILQKNHIFIQDQIM